MDQRQRLEGEYDQNVGANIKEIRRAVGMTQADLTAELSARGLDLAQQTIVKIEQGARPLRLREADLLADALGVDVDTLISNPEDTPAAHVAAVIHSTRDVEHAWTSVGHFALELEDKQQFLAEVLATPGLQKPDSLPAGVREAAEQALLLSARDLIETGPQPKKGHRRGQ